VLVCSQSLSSLSNQNSLFPYEHNSLEWTHDRKLYEVPQEQMQAPKIYVLEICKWVDKDGELTQPL